MYKEINTTRMDFIYKKKLFNKVVIRFNVFAYHYKAVNYMVHSFVRSDVLIDHLDSGNSIRLVYLDMNLQHKVMVYSDLWLPEIMKRN